MFILQKNIIAKERLFIMNSLDEKSLNFSLNKTTMKSMTIETIRMKLIKIAAL